MTTTVKEAGHALIISFQRARWTASRLRSLLAFAGVLVLIQLVLIYFFDQDFFTIETWTAREYFFTVLVIGGFALGALIEKNTTVIIDQRQGVVELEHSYPLKTVRERFTFAEIERFSADVINKYDSDAVQPRIILKNGAEIALGPEVSEEIGQAKAAIARAGDALAAHHGRES